MIFLREVLGVADIENEELQKANKIPIKILLPKLLSLTLPKTKEAAKSVNKTVVMG